MLEKPQQKSRAPLWDARLDLQARNGARLRALPVPDGRKWADLSRTAHRKRTVYRRRHDILPFYEPCRACAVPPLTFDATKYTIAAALCKDSANGKTNENFA